MKIKLNNYIAKFYLFYFNLLLYVINLVLNII